MHDAGMFVLVSVRCSLLFLQASAEHTCVIRSLDFYALFQDLLRSWLVGLNPVRSSLARLSGLIYIHE